MRKAPRLAAGLCGFVALLFTALLAGCATDQRSTIATATGAEKTSAQYAADTARLKRILSRRKSVASIEGTAKLTALPVLDVDTTRGDWQPLGPSSQSGKVFKIALSKQNADVIYAAYGRSGIWATRDRGATWRAITPQSNNPNIYFTVAVSPQDDKFVVAGIGDVSPSGRAGGFKAIHLSSDAGATWSDISPADLGDFTTVRILVHPTDRNKILALTSKRLYRTDDQGKTWRSLFEFNYTFGGDGWGGLPDLAAQPGGFDTLLVVHPTDGMHRTVNGGVSWQNVGTAVTDLGTTVLAWAPGDINTVYLQTFKPPGGQPLYNMRVWRSTDAGQTWTFRKDMPEFHQGRYDMSLSVSPIDANHVIAANAGYVVSRDGFATYTNNYAGFVDLLDAQFATNDPATIYVGADQGLAKVAASQVSLGTATRVDVGVRTLIAFDFAINETVSPAVGIVNAADYGAGLRGSTNAPTAWTSMPIGYEYSAFHNHPRNPNLVFNVGGGVALNRSTDGGVTWANVEFQSPVSRPYYGAMAFDPVNAQIAYVAGTKEIRKSTAAGAAGTWISIGPPSVVDNVAKIAVAKSDANVIYALESSWAANGKVYVTTNGGANWSTIDLQAPYPLDIDVHPSIPGTFIAGLAFDLLLCENYGATCRNIRPQPAALDTAFSWVRFNTNASANAALANEVYAGTEFGMLVSPDLGVTWKRLGHNFPVYPVLGVKWSANGQLYAATQSGIYTLRKDQFGQPAVPVMEQPISEPAGIRVRWSTAAGATQYRVFRDNQQVFIGEAAPGVFVDPKVSRGARYCYTIDALNQNGFSTRTAPICIPSQSPRQNTGDVSADGKFDIVYKDASGVVGVALMNGVAATASANILNAGSGWTVTHIADFNGDGKADLLVKNVDGRIATILLNGTAVLGFNQLVAAGTGYTPVVTGDFNGDGRSDVVLRNTDGSAIVLLMNGGVATSAAYVLTAGSPYSVTHTGDFNGDGKADIVIRHADGSAAILLMDGATVSAASILLSAGSPWSVSHIADLSGDGKDDIVIKGSDGSAAMLLMSGTTVTSAAFLLSPGSPYTVIRTGDFNGDGKADMLIKHTDGSVVILQMNGTIVTAATYLLVAGSTAAVAQVADYNGDGKSDILLRNADGSATAVLMNGGVVTAAGNVWGAGTVVAVP
jgi:FG-GAP-like repeat/Sortilin, neurotensin receptor 3,